MLARTSSSSRKRLLTLLIVNTADLTVSPVRWVLFLLGSLHLSPWYDIQQTYVGRWGEVSPTSPTNSEVPPQRIRELQACKESVRRRALSFLPWGWYLPICEVPPPPSHIGLSRDQTRRRGTGNLAKKAPTGHFRQLSQLTADIADLTIEGVQKLFLELETRPQTKLFRMTCWQVFQPVCQNIK